MKGSPRQQAWCYSCGKWTQVNVSLNRLVPQQSAQCLDCEESFYKAA